MRKPYGACIDCNRPMWISGSRCYECRPKLTLVCQACGLAFLSTTEAKACSHQCRKNLRDGLRCADCGKAMALTKGSSPQGEARCRPCRKLVPNASERHPCVDCGAMCWRERCRACFNKSTRIRPDDDSRRTRYQREQSAPGLTWSARAALREKWKRQGRPCAYCSLPATTIDHVLPLIRGGTNYEGNLVPACKPCNSSKSGRLVIEWRAGRNSGTTVSPCGLAIVAAVKKPTRIKPIKGETIELFRVCVCGMTYSGSAAYCSSRCHARSAYRLRVGIPLDVAPYAVRVA